jgi:hypothetical protein
LRARAHPGLALRLAHVLVPRHALAGLRAGPGLRARLTLLSGLTRLVRRCGLERLRLGGLLRLAAAAGEDHEREGTHRGTRETKQSNHSVPPAVTSAARVCRPCAAAVLQAACRAVCRPRAASAGRAPRGGAARDDLR